MPDINRVGDLELPLDFDYQRKEWSWERIGWIGMIIIALAGLLGVFGQGPLSNAILKSSALDVRYVRMERLTAPAKYKSGSARKTCPAEKLVEVWSFIQSS